MTEGDSKVGSLSSIQPQVQHGSKSINTGLKKKKTETKKTTQEPGLV